MDKLENKPIKELAAKVKKSNHKPVIIKELKTTKAMRKMGGEKVGVICICCSRVKP